MSALFVKTICENGRTVVADCRFTYPLKIAKPFYRDDRYTEIMVMCASPGMLAGDFYDTRFELGDNTKTIISAQSYQKLYDGAAEQTTRISVGEGASLCYLPYPTVPFAGSRFRGRTEITLTRSSRLFFGEILTCGRTGMGEQFAFSEFSSRISVRVDGKLVFLDNNRLCPSEAALNGIGFFECYSCEGLLYLFGADSITLPQTNGIEAAVSKAREGYAVRVLGNSGDAVYEFSRKVFTNLQVYS
jgi:urease accessory protein